MEVPLERRRLSWVAVAALIIAVGIGGAALALAIADGNDDDTSAPAAQVESLQHACEQWTSANPSSSDGTQWCGAMARWMRDQLDHNGMGPQMWMNPQSMRTTCQQWLSDRPTAADAASDDRCNAMVGWMSDHMVSWSGHDNWNDWMTDGPMMGS